MKWLPGLLLPLAIFAVNQPVFASEPTTDCVIRDFKSDLTLQVENRLDITETLKADCDNLGKHGIFRILPYKIAPTIPGDYTHTPIKLTSITDETGQSYQYQTITSGADQTIAWKIGDPDQTISGVKIYVIKYLVDNVVHPTKDGGQQLYWNLNGNFWQLPIDHFVATIHFPTGINKDNLQPKIFAGPVGSTAASATPINFTDPQTLVLEPPGVLPTNYGVTLQTSLPAGIINPYQPSFLQRYGQYLWYLLIPLVFLFCYTIWSKHGRDPKLHKAKMVQYAPPQNLKPLELGLIDRVGKLDANYVTATIIDLAVRGYLKIEQLEKKGLLGKPDWQLTLLKTDNQLADFEQTILEELFGATLGSFSPSQPLTTTISEHRNSFYTQLPEIEEMVNNRLKKQDLIDTSWRNWAGLLWLLAGAILFGMIFLAAFLTAHLVLSLVICLVIIVIFALLLPRQTKLGAELDYQLEGFKEYLAKAEKYRMPFYEKEGIFEKYLPYVIAFGLTTQWIKAMKQIYGSEKAAAYVPVWYGGSPGHAFAASDFDSNISSLSSTISQSISSSPSSSSGGGGFSGGGGGGGGGGSW